MTSTGTPDGLPSATTDIESSNPYASSPHLSPLEADVLWEYAKISALLKRLNAVAKSTSDTPNAQLLADLRLLEQKMGLVLTLYKASVWSVIVDEETEAAKAQAAAAAREEAEYDAFGAR